MSSARSGRTGGEFFTDEETEEAISAADVDGDGLIGFEEFRWAWEAQDEEDEFEPLEAGQFGLNVDDFEG